MSFQNVGDLPKYTSGTETHSDLGARSKIIL